MATYSEVYQALLRGIATLPADEARVLRAYYVDAYNWKEIPLALAMSSETVTRLFEQGTSRLKPILKGPQA